MCAIFMEPSHSARFKSLISSPILHLLASLVTRKWSLKISKYLFLLEIALLAEILVFRRQQSGAIESADIYLPFSRAFEFTFYINIFWISKVIFIADKSQKSAENIILKM